MGSKRSGGWSWEHICRSLPCLCLSCVPLLWGIVQRRQAPFLSALLPLSFLDSDEFNKYLGACQVSIPVLDLGIEGRLQKARDWWGWSKHYAGSFHTAGETQLAPLVCSNRIQRLRERQAITWPPCLCYFLLLVHPLTLVQNLREAWHVALSAVFDMFLLNVFERCGPGDVTVSETDLI